MSQAAVLKLWRRHVLWLAGERASKGFQRSDVSNLLRCTSRQARTLLEAMVEDGSLVLSGCGRAAKYFHPEVVKETA